MEYGTITNIQRFSLHDGPGIRTTVFFKGCPLRCKWCHNPETYVAGAELSYKVEKCIGCGNCVKSCAHGAVCAGPEGILYDSERCVKCFKCASNCPPKALFVCGMEKTVDALMSELLEDKGAYEKSGGGVTLSGGEATMQKDFVLRLIAALKRENIHVCLDTCGFCSSESFLKIAEKVDLCLFDIKHADSGRHKAITGVGNELIQKNLRLLNDAGKKIEIRIPVVPGLNNEPQNIDAVCGIIQGLDMVERVVLLGYHKLGLSKIYNFNQHQEATDVEQPKKEYLQELCDYMQAKLPAKKVTYR